MKTITFNDISILEFSISKREEKLVIVIVYSLIDSDGKTWGAKRIQLEEDEFTAGQKGKMKDILTFLISKIKTKEEI